MRIALLSDIHANREAFEAVLAKLSAQAIDRIALLGDIVGYGPDPEFCCDKAMELVAAGALRVLGNHDAAIEDPSPDMNQVAKAAIAWTRPRLGAAQKAFLAMMPETERLDDLLLVHASARAPRNWDYITGPDQAERSLRATDARVTVVGHVHVPQVWRLTSAGTATRHVPMNGVEIPLVKSQVWLAVMGAVGQPRDGNTAAAYGILDTKRQTITFERVAYDHFKTCRKLRDAGLPEALATRLLNGR